MLRRLRQILLLIASLVGAVALFVLWSWPESYVSPKTQNESKKFLIAFGYWEQLTQATNSLLKLTALAAYTGRQVVSHKCVGIIQWRGNDESRKEARAQFNLTSSVIKPLSFNDLDTNFFNVKLKFIAEDFIEQNLRPDYISIHLRAEAVLYHGRSMDFLKQCISELSERAQIVAGSLSLKVFLSTDFSKYGSDSRNRYLRNEAASIMELLTKKLIQPVTFDPTDYVLTDNGAIAIVETNILTAGRRLFLLGGGSFQAWIKNMFLTKNNFDNKLVDSSCIMI